MCGEPVVVVVVPVDALEAASVVMIAPVCCSFRGNIQQPIWWKPCPAERAIKAVLCWGVVLGVLEEVQKHLGALHGVHCLGLNDVACGVLLVGGR